MIKRALLLVSGTVTGLVGVLSYNPPNLVGAMASPRQESPIQDTQVTESSTVTQSQQGPSVKAQKTSQPAKTSSKKSASASVATKDSAKQATPSQPSSKPSGTFVGDVASTRYGPVQVEITVENGQITNAQALAYPNRDRRSLQISQSVIPWLSQETVGIQSASVMTVSGATFTSNGWNQSLDSALQKAGM